VEFDSLMPYLQCNYAVSVGWVVIEGMSRLFRRTVCRSNTRVNSMTVWDLTDVSLKASLTECSRIFPVMWLDWSVM
jgi:chorismate mutase